MAICPICGKKLVETTATTLKCPAPNEHAAGEPKIGAAILECPLKKGAIWAYVTDDSGKGLRQIPVTVAKAPDATKPTDPSGFSGFDPLDPGDDYIVEIEIPSNIKDDYYPPPRTKIMNVPVRNGEITSVQFKLERIAPLKVSVEYPEGFPGDLAIEVAASSNEFNPAFPMSKHLGYVIFPKLRKHGYTVNFTLSDQQKKLYRIEGGGSKPWSHDPYGVNEVTFKVIAVKLIELKVTEAHDLTGGKFWCLTDPVKKVRVQAVTEPNDREAWALLKWTGGAPTGENNEALVDIKNTGDFSVQAKLDVLKSVTIEVYDIVKIECPLPVKNSKWKAYVSNNVTRMKAITKPDEERVWKHLTWSEGTPTAAKNECDVALNPQGDRTVKALLDGRPAEGDLHICQWPRLEIEEVTFDSHFVLNDGDIEPSVEFQRGWLSGRPDPAPTVYVADCQPPICFTRGEKVRLQAWFTPKKQPTDEETVSIRGRGNFGEVVADVLIKPTDSVVEIPIVESTGLLPNHVDWDDSWTIDWEYKLEDGSWESANSTTHMLYLLLGDPLEDIYFTLLDISCRAAKDKNTENDFVTDSFKPFKTHTGDNKGFQRKGDLKRLSYYLKGYKTSGGPDAQSTEGILTSTNATGRCGGWATLLIHMWRMHGITTARKRWFIRAVATGYHDRKKRFLVKNCDFSSPSDNAGRYTHKGKATIKLPGVPGQGKTNPQFDFGDHVVVKYNNKLYDPSYGIGPFDTDAAYLDYALGGLGSTVTGEFAWNMSGTPQFISNECVRYADGFAAYTIHRQTLQDIANKYGTTADILHFHDSALSTLRATPGDVVPGDTVDVPVYDDGSFDITASAGYTISETLQEVTFDSIAAAHGVTKDAILDDPANAALKSTCLTPAGVMPGDVIYVTPASVPGGHWVIGHDL